MPEVPTTLLSLSVDVNQGSDCRGEGASETSTILPFHFSLSLISEKHGDGFKSRKKERKPVKTSTQSVTHSHNTRSLYHEL